jgi:hypothetical protein
MKRSTVFGLLCALCCVVGLTLTLPVTVSAQRSIRDITGTVVGVGGRFGGRSLPFRLIVNSYSSADDVQRLNSALQSGGQDEMLRVLSNMDAGRIQVGNNVGVRANAIISTPEGEGTRIIVLYQRNINFFEVRYGSRSEMYRFGYAEIFLNRRGNGQGTFIPAARVRLRDGNVWEVEDFGVYPARLIGLQERGGRRGR